MKACVIGAGASGIAICKALKDQDIDFDCFEKGSFVGGLWKYDNDNGLSSSYKSLHINTSRQMMAYSDFPMPEDYPDYPHHSLIYQYFERYVDHFGFREKIRFNTEVKSVTKNTAGCFQVTTATGQHSYEALFVCNGHHWDPKYAEFPGTFTGGSMHSHYYRSFQAYEDKRVLIIGIGNSAVDIACELSRVAARTVISTRSGAYIVPKYIFGVPADHLAGPPLPFLPVPIQRALLGLSLFLTRGDQRWYGVPKPDRPLLREHPTVSQELLNYVGHGKIAIKPNVALFNDSIVRFTDGTEESFDEIIYATGYHINFPFLDKSLACVENNVFPLYHKVVSPAHNNLFFLGLIQPLGPVMPLAELQAIWAAKILKGQVKLPDRSIMMKTIERDRAAMLQRYGTSSRHTLQVDFYPYKRLLLKEMSRMKVRNGILA